MLLRKLAGSSPRRGARDFHVAALQLHVSNSMADNVQRAAALVDTAAAQGAKLVALPECFTGKYGCDHFPSWAETVIAEAESSGGPSGAAMMRERAQRHGIVVTGGVIEAYQGKLWNTMPVYGPEGRLLATYRKIHLSRVLGVTSESDVLTAGAAPTTFEMPGAAAMRVGMLCCFDLRFRDLLAQYGPAAGAHGPCGLLCAPSAFLRATGTEHWDLVRKSCRGDRSRRHVLSSVQPLTGRATWSPPTWHTPPTIQCRCTDDRWSRCVAHAPWRHTPLELNRTAPPLAGRLCWLVTALRRTRGVASSRSAKRQATGSPSPRSTRSTSKTCGASCRLPLSQPNSDIRVIDGDRHRALTGRVL
eukprot:5536651-Prymnesium_polylepis.1